MSFNKTFPSFNLFYLWLHDIRYMVKDHSDSERENQLLALHGLYFSISSKGSFICTIPDRIVHTMLWSTGWNMIKAEWVHHEGSIWWPITPGVTKENTKYYPVCGMVHIKVFLLLIAWAAVGFWCHITINEMC